MPLQPIDPAHDNRVEHRTSTVNGYTYHYLYGVPASGSFTATVFLVSLSSSYLAYNQPVGKPCSCCAISCDGLVGALRWLTEHSNGRFTGGQTALQDGAFRSRCYYPWACELWHLISWDSEARYVQLSLWRTMISHLIVVLLLHLSMALVLATSHGIRGGRRDGPCFTWNGGQAKSRVYIGCANGPAQRHLSLRL